MKSIQKFINFDKKIENYWQKKNYNTYAQMQSQKEILYIRALIYIIEIKRHNQHDVWS